jgi:integrase
MGDTFRPVAFVCAYAGLLLSEALGIRWRDVDLKTGRLAVSATRAMRARRRVEPDTSIKLAICDFSYRKFRLRFGSVGSKSNNLWVPKLATDVPRGGRTYGP